MGRLEYEQSENTIPVEFKDWKEGVFTTINAIETGTPCLRYLVRQPDGHRDMDDLDSGEYVFGAFGFRREIGGEISQRLRPEPTFGGRPLIVYCPDIEDPFGMDFFGVTSPGLFNYEVLDKFQQKLSLVGCAHLHLHSPDMKGSNIVAFNGDGSLRHIEIKDGERRNHDSIILSENKVEFKLGSHLTGIRRKEDKVFGVPRWAFSEDMSAKITVQFSTETVQPEITITNNLPQNSEELRFGHPVDPHQFSNRQVGTEINVVSPSTEWEHTFETPFETSTIDIAKAKLVVSGTEVTLILSDWDTGEKSKIISADSEMFDQFSTKLQKHQVSDHSSLDVNEMASYSEYLFRVFHPLMVARTEAGISLKTAI